MQYRNKLEDSPSRDISHPHNSIRVVLHSLYHQCARTFVSENLRNDEFQSLYIHVPPRIAGLCTSLMHAHTHARFSCFCCLFAHAFHLERNTGWYLYRVMPFNGAHIWSILVSINFFLMLAVSLEVYLRINFLIYFCLFSSNCPTFFSAQLAKTLATDVHPFLPMLKRWAVCALFQYNHHMLFL